MSYDACILNTGSFILFVTLSGALWHIWPLEALHGFGWQRKLSVWLTAWWVIVMFAVSVVMKSVSQSPRQVYQFDWNESSLAHELTGFCVQPWDFLSPVRQQPHKWSHQDKCSLLLCTKTAQTCFLRVFSHKALPCSSGTRNMVAEMPWRWNGVICWSNSTLAVWSGHSVEN